MPAQKRSVEWFQKNSGGLSEIYQQTGMVFSFLSSPKDGYKQCHEWIRCRDFLHDAVRTTITGNASSIYGFRFDLKTNPPTDLRKMRMLVSKNGLKTLEDINEFKDKMKAGLKLLQHFEKYAGVALSTMKEIEPKGSKKKYVVLFTGSTIWMKSPFLVSMYTYLIRLGDKKLEFKTAAQLKKAMQNIADNGAKDNDVTYLKAMWRHLHTVMKERNNLFTKKDGFDETYFQNTSINNFHNQGGILSLIQARTPNNDLNKRVNKLIHAK